MWSRIPKGRIGVEQIKKFKVIATEYTYLNAIFDDGKVYIVGYDGRGITYHFREYEVVFNCADEE